MAFSFIVFALVMNKIFYQPINKTTDERTNYIDSNIQTAKNARAKASELMTEYEGKIIDARKQASQIVNTSTSTANEKKAATINEANEKTQEQYLQAKEALQNDVEAAKAQLKNEVVSLASHISAKILGEQRALSSVPPELIDKYFEAGQ